MIRITAKTDGFRRCGIAHPAAPTEYPDDHFGKEELKALAGEPELTVETVAVKAATGNQAKLNANDTIALVKAAKTSEELDELAKGEERTTVIAAIEARRKELEA
ncbi:MAG: HI1506-related protein [Thermodesulfobacteriota bacterium]